MTPRRLAGRIATLSIRWRLALISAGLTFAILLVFALVIGAFTADRLRSDFDREVRETALDLSQRIPVRESSSLETPLVLDETDIVEAIVAAGQTGDAAVRIVTDDGPLYGSADLGPLRVGVTDWNGYRVVSEGLGPPGSLEPAAYLQYGREPDGLRATIARVQLFLALGVLGGTLLALFAGLAVARRAMGPIASMTRAAKGIARTGDPAGRMPEPRADDEVADLARTLEEMLRSLDGARRETEAMLARQRDFVADASHELRTPLTSVLANLELLEAALEGEDREIAGSALRSTQRMRRLVGDLLFLARADAGRPSESTLAPTDLGVVVRDVAAETAPLATSHTVTVDAEESVVVDGSPDELHRLVLNLVQNAVAHTPPGTHVTAVVRRDGSGHGVLEVTDDGPGVPAEVRDRAFERFVRGAGDARAASSPGGRGSGLGLAIVRAVVEAHGGSVSLEDAPCGGARFTARLRLAASGAAPPAPELAPAGSTETGGR